MRKRLDESLDRWGIPADATEDFDYEFTEWPGKNRKKKEPAGNGEKDDKVSEAEYHGRDVELNKPMRGDQKKFKVYVKNPSTGNVKKVNFGSKEMEIKRDDPERRKSFRARHKCDTADDKTTARYWSCKMWSKKKVSDIV